MPPKPVKRLGGVYYIKLHSTTPAALELKDGHPYDGTEITYNHKKAYNDMTCLNQLWLIKPISTKGEAYTIVNLQGGTHMEAAESRNLSPVVGTKGYTSKDYQKWIIKTPQGSKLYKIQSVAFKTFVEASGTVLSIKLHNGSWDTNKTTQLWSFERVSRSYLEVKEIVRNNKFLLKNHQSYLLDSEYLILDRAWLTSIWNSSKLGSTKWRSEIFDCDDFAITLKAHVAGWGNTYIRANGVALFFGIMLGRDMNKNPPPAHAYNFTLNAQRTAIEFFEPQNGKYTSTSQYNAYVSIY